MNPRESGPRGFLQAKEQKLLTEAAETERASALNASSKKSEPNQKTNGGLKGKKLDMGENILQQLGISYPQVFARQHTVEASIVSYSQQAIKGCRCFRLSLHSPHFTNKQLTGKGKVPSFLSLFHSSSHEDASFVVPVPEGKATRQQFQGPLAGNGAPISLIMNYGNGKKWIFFKAKCHENEHFFIFKVQFPPNMNFNASILEKQNRDDASPREMTCC